MKKNRKSARVVFLGAFIALAVIAIAGMNMRTLINSDGLMGTARKAGANDAVVGDVLENYTFTSDTAGTGIMGSITDYSQTLTQLKLLASSANQIVTLPLNPGYYTQIKLDTTEVYESGYDDGFAYAMSNLKINLNVPTYTGYRYWSTFWLENVKAAKSLTITDVQYTEGAYNSGDIFRFYIFDPDDLDSTDFIDVSLENLSLPYTVAVTNKKISSINLGSHGTSGQSKYIVATFTCNY